MPELRITPPLLGLSDDQTFTDQPPETTRSARNVRALSKDGRTRLSQRSGLSKFVDAQVNGAVKVQHLASAVQPGANVSFSSALTEGDLTLEWEGNLSGGACRDITADRAGLVYALDGPSSVKILNREGTQLGNIEVGLDTGGTSMLGRVLVDEVTGNLFVVDIPRADWTDASTLSIETATNINQSEGATRIRMFSRVGAAYSYELIWESPFDANLHFSDIDLRGSALYACATNSSGDTAVSGNYVLKYLIAGNIPVEVGRERFVDGASLVGQQMRMAATESGEVFVAVNDTRLALESLAPDPTDTELYRFDSSLKVVSGWPEAGTTARGFGSALHYNEASRKLYSVGYNNSQAAVVLAVDVSEEAFAEEWSKTFANWSPLDPFLVCDSDAQGNLYVPASFPGNPTGDWGFRVFSPDDGTGVVNYIPAEQDGTGDLQPHFAVSTDKIELAFGGGLANAIPYESIGDLTTSDWTETNSPVITTDADAGPFYDGTANLVRDTSAGATVSVEFDAPETPIGLVAVTDMVLSAWVKPNPADPPSESSLSAPLVAVAGSTELRVDIDWSTSPPTLSTPSATLDASKYGIFGPLNGYYRVWLFAGKLDPVFQYTSAKLRIRPASDGNSDTGGLFVYRPKMESNPDQMPTALNQLYGTELVFMGSQGAVLTGSSDEPFDSTRAVRMVTATVNSDVLRRRLNFAVAGGRLRLFDDTEVLGVATDNNLSSDAQFVDSTTAFGTQIFVDGVKALGYEFASGELTEFKAQSAGSVPDYPQLVTTWGGRVVMARFAGNEDDWAMSAIGAPFDWDFGTVVDLPTAAVNGTTAPFAGRVPDIITSLVPISDDLLLFGCDSSIHRLTGNPKVDGQIDLISDITGMGFGKAWAKDPEGNLYFIGSKGRLYFAEGGIGVPRPVTENTIDRRIESVDLSAYRFQLEWNYRERGLHIFVVPYGAGGTAVDHWFFERKNGGIWEDRTGSTSVQPTTAMVLDGDALGDRVVLLGCEDGYIRTWDEEAADDDGSPIDAHCLMGPFSLPNDREVRMSNLRAVMAAGLGGANVEVYAEDEPDELGSAVWSGRFEPGRNPNVRMRARGSYVYLRLQNRFAGETWALESLHAMILNGGRRRIRG